ncbi:MAG: MBL fold metallo-hydrolase [Microscillaceae bacterium]
MKLTFWGASRQVTGSMFLLETEDDFRLLVDCGMDMERRDVDPAQYVGLFPFEPSMIQAVVLTHAHIDHSGLIPNLLREGFEGRIYTTSATYELAALLLEDAASLNQKKLKRMQKKKRQLAQLRQSREYQELYLHNQVNQALDSFVTLPFQQRTRLAKGLYLTLIPAGHLLGAAHVLLEIEEEGQTKTICFSGDLGRKNYPLLVDPEPVPEVDYLICESTYGNRHHESKEAPEEPVFEIIKSTCVDIPGRLIVPAFSVGRTQALLYTLNKLRAEGRLPAIKVFTDSPLALKSTEVHQKYHRWLNAEAQAFQAAHGRLFDFDNLIYLESIKESKAVANYHEPCIIVSSSGMIQGGRIEYHVKENLSNPYATIFMIGYAAEGTLGHDLREGNKSVKIDKHEVPIQARIESIDNFSGHGDVEDLLEFVRHQSPLKLKKLFLVHGEWESMQDFEKVLHEAGYAQVAIPRRGESFVL